MTKFIRFVSMIRNMTNQRPYLTMVKNMFATTTKAVKKEPKPIRTIGAKKKENGVPLSKSLSMTDLLPCVSLGKVRRILSRLNGTTSQTLEFM